MTMQEKFEIFHFNRGANEHINAEDVKAWIGRAEKESNARAQIEAYDNVRRLAHSTSHKQYAEVQIARLNKVIGEASEKAQAPKG